MAGEYMAGGGGRRGKGGLRLYNSAHALQATMTRLSETTLAVTAPNGARVECSQTDDEKRNPAPLCRWE